MTHQKHVEASLVPVQQSEPVVVQVKTLEPRLLSGAELRAVSGGPVVQNDTR